MEYEVLRKEMSLRRWRMWHLVIGCGELHKEMSHPVGLRGECHIMITTQSRSECKPFLFLCNIL